MTSSKLLTMIAVMHQIIIIVVVVVVGGGGGSQDSAVGIATRYRLDGPGDRIPVGARFSTPDQSWGPPSLPYNRYQVFPGGKVAGGVALTTHPHLAPRLTKE
jgi:hypothetical protein